MSDTPLCAPLLDPNSTIHLWLTELPEWELRKYGKSWFLFSVNHDEHEVTGSSIESCLMLAYLHYHPGPTESAGSSAADSGPVHDQLPCTEP